MIHKFARAYAKASLALAPEEAVAKRLLADLENFVLAMEEVPAIQSMARNPAIPLATKLAAVDEIAASLEASDLAKRLLAMLTENYRLPHLANVTAAVRQQVKQRLGIVEAQVTSAVPLEETQTLQLRRMLESSWGKKVELEVSVEPKLLGGFVAQVGSRRYDVSLKGQLERMTREMAAATA